MSTGINRRLAKLEARTGDPAALRRAVIDAQRVADDDEQAQAMARSYVAGKRHEDWLGELS